MYELAEEGDWDWGWGGPDTSAMWRTLQLRTVLILIVDKSWAGRVGEGRGDLLSRPSMFLLQCPDEVEPLRSYGYVSRWHNHMTRIPQVDS